MVRGDDAATSAVDGRAIAAVGARAGRPRARGARRARPARPAGRGRRPCAPQRARPDRLGGLRDRHARRWRRAARRPSSTCRSTASRRRSTAPRFDAKRRGGAGRRAASTSRSGAGSCPATPTARRARRARRGRLQGVHVQQRDHEFAAADDLTLYEGMARAARLGLPVAVHAESDALTAGLGARAVAAGPHACATTSPRGRSSPRRRRSRARSTSPRRRAARCTSSTSRPVAASRWSPRRGRAASTSGARRARTTSC